MADNLCGPSNALQNFQKHSSVDRTLQQDRLTGRPSPSQGFRSAPGPNGGLIDHEFEAFQAGHLPLESAQNFHNPSFHAPPPHLQQHAAPSWANDFQQLNISSPPQARFQQHSLHQSQPQLGGWHQEFAAQGFGAQGSVAQGKQPVMQMGTPTNMNSVYNPWSHRISGVAIPQSQFTPMQTGSSQSQSQNEVFDDEAFARAFDEAAQAELSHEQEIHQTESTTSTQLHQQPQEEILLSESASKFMNEEPHEPWRVHDQAPLGADTILEDDPKQPPDALSRTAGQLLDSVRHNQSDKFQNSQFLQLMRQFRDREVVVEGDKLVDVGGGGAGAGTGGGRDMSGMQNEQMVNNPI
ncbi:hypothetical protein ACMFMG_000937 [Clarireedia jacksonii]